MMDLWPFQKALYKDLRAGFRKHRSQCAVSPTGSGKTRLAAAITTAVYNDLSGRHKSIALYLVHRKELVEQTVATLGEGGFALGQDVGVIQSGHPVTPWAPLQVASIQTIVRRLDKLTWLNPKLIFIDETHHAAATTWERVLSHYHRSFRIGLTATPCRLDGKGLKPFFDRLVIGPQILDITPDYLCPVRTFTIPAHVDLKGMSMKAQASTMTGPVIANVVENWVRLASDRPSIFFCVNTEHSRNTAQKLQNLGFGAKHLDFKTPDAERRRALNDFREGRLQCLTNVELFTEGMDAKNCSCAVIARRTKSLTLWKQMNGRMMRKKPEGQYGICIDAADNVHGSELGVPDADVEWSLTDGVTTETRQSVGHSHRRCEACGYEYHKKASECPLCGAVPVKTAVSEVDAAVKEVSGKPKFKPTRRTLTREIMETNGDYDKLKKVARKYGYHQQWARRMKSIYFAFDGRR